MDGLIHAKFLPPVWMGDQLRRDQLLDRLNLALQHRLTLIHAPAGYGKTSLLSQWRGCLDPVAVQVAWLTLERDDADLKRLLPYLSSAIEGRDPGDEADGESEPGFADLPPRAALSAIIKRLGREARPMVLILDDVHQADSPQVIDFLQALIRLAPSSCHFVIASRDYPWLGQSVLAAEDQLLELTADDLRFSVHEAESLLTKANGEQLSSMDLQNILDRTEGWPIALQLTSLSLKRGIDYRRVIERFSGSRSDLARYLSEQVLTTLPDETQEIVARTALLDRLTGELVDLLCDRKDGWMVLERLEQQGVFLAPASPERQDYRYHQLFAEYLRERLARSDPEKFRFLQRRAAGWFAERGDVAEAVSHGIESEDHEVLASILENAGGWRLIPQGMQGVVERGLSKLPDSVIWARPRLALAKVYLGIKHGEMGTARADFDHFATRAEAEDFSADLRTEIRVVGDTLADYENLPVSFDDLLAREALLRKLPANDHLVQANISETLGAKYFEGGWLERALEPTLAAREHYLALGSLYSDLFTRFLEARIKRAQGRPKEAEAILSAARLEIEGSFGDRSDLAANCAAFQAELFYEQDRRTEARALLEWALPHMEQSDGWVDVYSAAYCTAARALAAEGAMDEARAITARARRVARRRRLRQLELLADLCELELLILHGQTLDAAHELADALDLEALARSMREEAPLYRPVSTAASLCHIRLDLLAGNFAPALAELAELRRWASQRGAGRLLVDANILAAYALRGLGRIAESRAQFDEAVGMAMFQGLIRPFIDAHRFVAACLDDTLNNGSQIDRFRSQFLRIIAKSLAVLRSSSSSQGMLNPAEAEILHHLSHGYSNKEIARLIGMSPDTVKYRLKSVFRKIGVSKRRDAVRVSRERGLDQITPPPAITDGTEPVGTAFG